MLVQALKCDVTRVGVVQLGPSGAGQTTPVWPDDGIDINKDLHQIAHADIDSPTGAAATHRVALESWIYTQFAYLLEQLDAVPEGDGTMLDNAVVLAVKPMGVAHESRDQLFLLAGGKNAGVRSGRYSDAGDRSHTHLLATCANLCGMNVAGFGDPDFNGLLDVS